MTSVSAVPGRTPGAQQRAPLLEVIDVSLSFGGVPALTEVSMSLGPSTITGLIGPNGAGKSTLFNCVSRFYTPSHGQIRFLGRNLLRRRPHELAHLGVARTFQHTSLFGDMTVEDNLRLGVPDRILWSPASILGTPLRCRRRRSHVDRRTDEILERYDLADTRRVPASELDYPRRKRAELARALMSSPTLLLLDEPAAGLSSDEAVAMSDQIRMASSEQGVSVLLVEHNVSMVMSACDHIYVLDSGRNLADGPAHVIQADDRVAEVFLGTSVGAPP